MGFFQQMWVSLHFTSTLSSVCVFLLHRSSVFLSSMILRSFFHPLVCHSEESSFIVLDHSGIFETEFISLLEETQFTILITAYPAPKITWMKDNNLIPESYYVFTQTSHFEGNRWAEEHASSFVWLLLLHTFLFDSSSFFKRCRVEVKLFASSWTRSEKPNYNDSHGYFMWS